MSNVYTEPTISGYAPATPPDDGTTGSNNVVHLAGGASGTNIKTDYTDPVKTFATAISTNVLAAFTKIFLNAVTAISATYTVVAGDRGKLLSCTNTITVTLLAAATAGSGFVLAFRNNGSGTVTLDGNASETINGSATITLSPGTSVILVCDGSNWIGEDPSASLSANNLFTGNNNFQGTVNYLAATGTDTYTATFSPALTAYTTGAEYSLKIANANTSTTPTLNLNSLGAKTIVKEGSVALIPGDMPANHEATFRYNGTNMVLLNPKWPSGSVIQVVNATTTSYAACTTAIPNDDTIPQITEGDQVMTCVITPKTTTTKLLIQVVVQFSDTATNDQTAAALFQDATANALAAARNNSESAQSHASIIFNHYMTSNITTATTFRVRLGPSSTATVYFNGASAGRDLGGVSSSSITIWEIAP